MVIEMEIEDTIFEKGLPVNTIAMLNRLKNLLEENGTNCLKNCRDDIRVKKLMWLINRQFYGEQVSIDLWDEWDQLKKIDESQRSETP